MATAKSHDQLQVNLPTCEMKFSREYLFPCASRTTVRHNIFEKVILFSRRGSFPRLFSDSELNAVNFRSKTVCFYNVLHWVGHVFNFFSVIAFKFILAVQRFSRGGMKLTSNPRRPDVWGTETDVQSAWKTGIEASLFSQSNDWISSL
jgi:hypothetical protein